MTRQQFVEAIFRTDRENIFSGKRRMGANAPSERPWYAVVITPSIFSLNRPVVSREPDKVLSWRDREYR